MQGTETGWPRASVATAPPIPAAARPCSSHRQSDRARAQSHRTRREALVKREVLRRHPLEGEARAGDPAAFFGLDLLRPNDRSRPFRRRRRPGSRYAHARRFQRSAPLGKAMTGVPEAAASIATSELVSGARLGISTQRAAASRRRLRAKPTGPRNLRPRSSSGRTLAGEVIADAPDREKPRRRSAAAPRRRGPPPARVLALLGADAREHEREPAPACPGGEARRPQRRWRSAAAASPCRAARAVAPARRNAAR